jgi:large subunit ribosomal protein L4
MTTKGEKSGKGKGGDASMASCKLYRMKDGKVGTTDVDVTSLGRRSPRRIQREAVLMYEANRRAGTHDTLTRSEVNDSKIKPWKQKHTGRARAGFKGSPLWVGGGIIHGPHPRDYSYALPRKELRAATRAALAGKFRDGEIALVDGLALDAPKTKRVAEMIESLGMRGSWLIVLPEADENVWKSARNIEGVSVVRASDVNAYDLLKNRTVIFTEKSLELVRERIGPARTKEKAHA